MLIVKNEFSLNKDQTFWEVQIPALYVRELVINNYDLQPSYTTAIRHICSNMTVSDIIAEQIVKTIFYLLDNNKLELLFDYNSFSLIITYHDYVQYITEKGISQ